MKDKEIRQYVSMVIQEALSDYFTTVDLKAQTKGVQKAFKSFKKFFSRDVGNVTQDWIDEKEESEGIVIPPRLKKEIEDFAKTAWERALERSDGDKREAVGIFNRTLNSTFWSDISSYSRAQGRQRRSGSSTALDIE